MLLRNNFLIVVALAAAAVLLGTAGVAQAALIGYWPLNENTGADDGFRHERGPRQ